MATVIVMLTASYEGNSATCWNPLSVRDVAGAYMRFRTLHHFLKLYIQVLLFSTVPGLPILSASEMHLLHLSQKIPCSPQPKVACLSPGPRGCPAEKDMVPDVMGETRRGLALIPIPCLHEQVVPSAGASCWFWYPCQYHPFMLEQQCKSWEMKKIILLFSY